MRHFTSLYDCAGFLSLYLSKPVALVRATMLDCPTHYRLSGNLRLRLNQVPAEGSLSHVDGVVLYTLARLLQAQNIIELGTFRGHSTNYLAEAVWKNGGRVDTVDLVRYWGKVWRGHAITLANRQVVRQHKADAYEYLLRRPQGSVDMIFEDTSHDYYNTRGLIDLTKIVLKPGGLLVIHDVAVDKVPGCRVQEAVDDSGLPFECFTVWPGNQGLAVWRKP